MTTIATDGKSMAADSLTSGKGERLGYCTKVHRTTDGRIFASSGCAVSCRMFARWMIEGGEKPDLDDDFRSLILQPDGRVMYMNKRFEPVEYMAPMGLGSGGDFAIGAMLAGKSPEEAVALALTRDGNSGGDITVLHL